MEKVTLLALVCDGFSVVPMILDVVRRNGHSIDQLRLVNCEEGGHDLDVIISLSTRSGTQTLIARLRTICALNGQAKDCTTEIQTKEKIECER